MSQKSKYLLGVISLWAVNSNLAGEAVAPWNVESYAVGDYSIAVYGDDAGLNTYDDQYKDWAHPFDSEINQSYGKSASETLREQVFFRNKDDEANRRKNIEDMWQERESNLTPFSPEYYELKAEKDDAYADWYPDMYSFYKEQARWNRNYAADKRRSAKEQADRDTKFKADQDLRGAEEKMRREKAAQEEVVRREEERSRLKLDRERESQKRKWERDLWKLKEFSSEWYRLKAETYRIQAEWYPDKAWMYNLFYADNLKRGDEKEEKLHQKAREEENKRNRNEAQKQAEKDKLARQAA